jgi:MFS family permease
VRRLLLLASAVVFVDTLFYAAITPLLPGLAGDFGLSKTAAGVLVAAYPAGTFLGALPGGWLAARAGVRPTVLLGLALMGVSSLAFAFAQSAQLLDVARLVQGVGGACSWAGAFGWLIGAAPRERRGELIGTAMAAAIAGSLMGPVLGAGADLLGRGPVFATVAVLGAVIAAWALRTPAARPTRPARLGELLSATANRQVAGGMWLVGLPGLLFGTLGVLAPLGLGERGAGAATIAAVFLVAGLLEATVNPLVGRLTDRRGRTGPVLLGLAATTTVFTALAFADRGWLLAALVVCAAPAVGMLWTPAMALLSDGAEVLGLEQGFAFALMNLAWALGQTAGSAGSARLADLAGDPLPYLLLAALCLASLAAAARALRRLGAVRAWRTAGG